MSGDMLVKVDGVSKKFCRSLKQSLWYGVQDVGRELLAHEGDQNDLRKQEFWALKDVSFELKRGECLGLIGANGAGKSTLLKILNGLIKPDQGRVAMRGRVCALIELGAGFNPILTARENIYVNGAVLGLSKKEIDLQFDEIIDFSELESFIDTPVQSFSSGMKVRLGFAIAVQMKPDVLIIDEVLAVGDVGFRNKCYNAIYKMSDRAAVIFVSHNMNHIERTSTTCMLLDKGSIIGFSKNRSQVIQQYFDLFSSEHSKNNMADGVDLKEIRINNEPAAKWHKQVHGDPFQLELTASYPEHVKSLEVSLSFLSSELSLVANVNSLVDEVRFAITEDLHCFRIDLPSLDLGSGTFHPSLTVRDAGTNEILIWMWAFTDLRMQSNSYHPAPVQFHGEWKGISSGPFLSLETKTD